jgi:hypothetical protein
MSFTNSLNTGLRTVSGGVNRRSSGSGTRYGRVVDIILDENHRRYKELGGGTAINGVFYLPLEDSASVEEMGTTYFAYQSSAHIKLVPIVGEIVELTKTAGVRPGNGTRMYYTGIVNVWNSSNSGVYLNTGSDLELNLTSNGTFLERADINPIRSTPGDVQIEGRQGQSIRFTGSKGRGNLLVDDDNLGKPLTILSNGQSEKEGGFLTITENVDLDSNSIYLASDHRIRLTPASTKRLSYDDIPTQSDHFRGNQVVINGGRLYFNAKLDDIQLSSITSVGINTEGSVNIDASTYSCIDAPFIYLGHKARTSPNANKEPVLLGNQTEIFLEIMLNMMQGMATDMAAAKTIDGKPIPTLNKRGMSMKTVLKNLKRQLNPGGPSNLKSKKVFTE